MQAERVGGPRAAQRGHLRQDDEQETWSPLQSGGDGAGPDLPQQIQGKTDTFDTSILYVFILLDNFGHQMFKPKTNNLYLSYIYLSFSL